MKLTSSRFLLQNRDYMSQTLNHGKAAGVILNKLDLILFVTVPTKNAAVVNKQT